MCPTGPVIQLSDLDPHVTGHTENWSILHAMPVLHTVSPVVWIHSKHWGSAHSDDQPRTYSTNHQLPLTSTLRSRGTPKPRHTSSWCYNCSHQLQVRKKSTPRVEETSWSPSLHLDATAWQWYTLNNRKKWEKAHDRGHSRSTLQALVV